MRQLAFLSRSVLVGFFVFVVVSIWGLSSVQATGNNLFRPQRVPSIEVRNLAQFKGKYISVYYAIGRKSFLGFGAQEERLEITKLKAAKIADYMISEDTLLLPERQINREADGFNLAYNLVVFVIHTNPAFSWVNIDANLKLSYPAGENASANHEAFAVNYITKSGVDKLLADANGQEPLIYNFGTIMSTDP